MDQRVMDYLARALDDLLAALVIVGGRSSLESVPGAALDAVLASDPGVQRARAAFREALRGLGELGVDRDAILDVESAVHAYVAAGAEAGYQLGARVRR